MTQIKWDASKDDVLSISGIARRVHKKFPEIEMFEIDMDLTACHLNGCPLDLDKLADFDDFNFYHDIFGIRNNINRTNGKLKEVIAA